MGAFVTPFGLREAWVAMQSAANAVPLDSADLRRRDWLTILLIGVAHSSSHFFQLVLPSLYVSLGLTFDLDFARLGLLVSIFYVVSGKGCVDPGWSRRSKTRRWRWPVR